MAPQPGRSRARESASLRPALKRWCRRSRSLSPGADHAMAWGPLADPEPALPSVSNIGWGRGVVQESCEYRAEKSMRDWEHPGSKDPWTDSFVCRINSVENPLGIYTFLWRESALAITPQRCSG